jgi:hypothetical protein
VEGRSSIAFIGNRCMGELFQGLFPEFARGKLQVDFNQGTLGGLIVGYRQGMEGVMDSCHS